MMRGGATGPDDAVCSVFSQIGDWGGLFECIPNIHVEKSGVGALDAKSLGVALAGSIHRDLDVVGVL